MGSAGTVKGMGHRGRVRNLRRGMGSASTIKQGGPALTRLGSPVERYRDCTSDTCTPGKATLDPKRPGGGLTHGEGRTGTNAGSPHLTPVKPREHRWARLHLLTHILT